MPEEKSWKYRIQYERAPSAKTIDGFKVEAQGDDLKEAQMQAYDLYTEAIGVVETHYPQLKTEEKKEK